MNIKCFLIRIPLFFSLLVCLCTSLEAQQTAATDVTGKMALVPSGGVFRSSGLAQLDAASRNAVNRSLNAMLGIIAQSPALNPPRGFDVRNALAINPPSKFTGTSRVDLDMHILLFQLWKKKGSDAPKPEGESGSNLFISTNNLDFITDHARYYGDIFNKVKFPPFFEKPPISDSTNDYMELNYAHTNFSSAFRDFRLRILTRNNKPLFIPLTRKDYVEFLKAYELYRAADDQEVIDDMKKSIPEYEAGIKNKATTEEIRKIFENALKEINEKKIPKYQQSRDGHRLKAAQYDDRIASMSVQEAAFPAYVGEGYIVPLEQYGKYNGHPLYKVNPDYFDAKLPISAVQVIIVSYWYHNLFCSDYMKQKVRDAFYGIDFHRLKGIMK